jgi:hypothetical protein
VGNGMMFDDHAMSARGRKVWSLVLDMDILPLKVGSERRPLAERGMLTLSILHLGDKFDCIRLHCNGVNLSFPIAPIPKQTHPHLAILVDVKDFKNLTAHGRDIGEFIANQALKNAWPNF